MNIKDEQNLLEKVEDIIKKILNESVQEERSEDENYEKFKIELIENKQKYILEFEIDFNLLDKKNYNGDWDEPSYYYYSKQIGHIQNVALFDKEFELVLEDHYEDLNAIENIYKQK